MSEFPLNKRFCFSKQQRLLNSSDFSRVFDNAPLKASHPQFLILAKLGNTSPRLGLVIAKKNVRLAVDRNKVKRLIRESFRHKQHHLPTIDAIVLARRGADNLSSCEMSKILNQLWKRVIKQAQKQTEKTLQED